MLWDISKYNDHLENHRTHGQGSQTNQNLSSLVRYFWILFVLFVEFNVINCDGKLLQKSRSEEAHNKNISTRFSRNCVGEVCYIISYFLFSPLSSTRQPKKFHQLCGIAQFPVLSIPIVWL